MRADRIPTGTAFVLSGATWLHENLTETKIVKAERKRDLVPGFPRRILSKTMSKIQISRMQKQIYLHFAEAKYLRRSQNTKKPGQTQPESDFIQAKSKIVKGERKRELVPCFPRRILSKTMSKIGRTRKKTAKFG